VSVIVWIMGGSEGEARCYGIVVRWARVIYRVVFTVKVVSFWGHSRVYLFILSIWVLYVGGGAVAGCWFSGKWVGAVTVVCVWVP
jgi:hypothetical protein